MTIQSLRAVVAISPARDTDLLLTRHHAPS